MFDYQVMSSDVISGHVYNKLTWPEVDETGAWGKNADATDRWNIELQRYGENLIVSGTLHNKPDAIAMGFRVFDWGFNRQASDGSFVGTADPFHQTALFVSSVARACLFVRRSPVGPQYESQISGYAPKAHLAAKWMVRPEIWSRGISNNSPYTHRRYVVAGALSLAGNFDGGDGRLGDFARTQIQDALSLQTADGINPEKSGYDVSYQGVGLFHAAIWADYFSRDALVPSIHTMAERGLTWEEKMVNLDGSLIIGDSTRVGQEAGPSGVQKTVDWRKVATAFYYWAAILNRPSWQQVADRIVNYYS